MSVLTSSVTEWSTDSSAQPASASRVVSRNDDLRSGGRTTPRRAPSSTGFCDAGGNFVDTANNYGDPPGRSESILGDVLSGRRDHVVLATKVRFATGDDVNDRGLSRRHIRSSATRHCAASAPTDRTSTRSTAWGPRTSARGDALRVDDLVRDGNGALRRREQLRRVAARQGTPWSQPSTGGSRSSPCNRPTIRSVTRDIERGAAPASAGRRTRGDAVRTTRRWPAVSGNTTRMKHRPPTRGAGATRFTRRGMSLR